LRHILGGCQTKLRFDIPLRQILTPSLKKIDDKKNIFSPWTSTMVTPAGVKRFGSQWSKKKRQNCQFLLSYFCDFDALFRVFRDGLSAPVNVFELNFTI